MTQALNPKVAEIKEKYADNKDLQNQMVALLYQETKVNDLQTIRRSSFRLLIHYLITALVSTIGFVT